MGCLGFGGKWYSRADYCSLLILLLMQVCILFSTRKMGSKVWMCLLLAISAVVASAAVEDSLETPQYTVVHAESDFEIRLFRPSTWVSTPVDDISFGKATQIGFHK